MVGVPYFVLAVLVFSVYRGMKKNEAFRRAREALGEPNPTAVARAIADQAS